VFIILIINDFAADMIGKKITAASWHSFLLLKDYEWCATLSCNRSGKFQDLNREPPTPP